MREYKSYILTDLGDGVVELVFDHPLFIDDQMNLSGIFDRNDLIITNGDGDQVCVRDVYRGEWMACYYAVFFEPLKGTRKKVAIEV